MDIPDSMHAPYDLRYEAVTMDTHVNYQRNEADQGAFSFTHIRQSRLLNSLKSKIKYKKQLILFKLEHNPKHCLFTLRHLSLPLWYPSDLLHVLSWEGGEKG